MSSATYDSRMFYFVEGMMSAKAGRYDEQYMVRFPPGMRDRIKVAASENGRSMNSEIIARLEESLRLDGVATTIEVRGSEGATPDDLMVAADRLADQVVDKMMRSGDFFDRFVEALRHVEAETGRPHPSSDLVAKLRPDKKGDE